MFKKRLWAVLILAAVIALAVGSADCCLAAQFDADVIVKGPKVFGVYRLQVGQTHYRIQKTKGFPNLPSFPLIVNCKNRQVWILMPEPKQYAVVDDPKKVFMLDPLIGWELTRGLMKSQEGPREKLGDYLCRTVIFTLASRKQPAGKMWYSDQLDHVIKDVRYGGNEDAILELQNIRVRPQDAGLFKIPAGYGKVESFPPKAPGTTRAPQGKVGHELEIILDASGSMKGKMGGETKMQIARKALLDLVGDIKDRDDLALAIRVYGHQSPRSQKDCQDSRLEMTFGRVDPGRVQRLLDRVKPQGYTPLTYSLMRAAGDFKGPGAERSLILITDGLETCGGDPCRAARKLASAGLKITLHVVGFGLKKGELKKLACLTKPSGGLLLEAGNTRELKKALTKAVRQTTKNNLIVKAVSAGGKPRQVHTEVFDSKGERLAIHQGAVTRFSLPPGRYDVVVRDSKTSQVVKLNRVAVKPDQVTEKVASFASGRLKVVFKSTKGQAFNKGYVEVIRMEEGKEGKHRGDYLTGSPRVFNLTPGSYTIKAQVDNLGHQVIMRDVVVEPEREVVREAVFGRAKLSVAVLDAQGKPLPYYAELWRLEAGSPSGYKSGSGQTQPLSFEGLVPGRYRIEAKRKDTGKKITTPAFELPDGADMRKEVVIP